MRQFISRLLLFFLVNLSIIVSFELLLPDNFFTFRPVEALKFTNEWIPHIGPFFPNRELSMYSKGDLCPHSKDAVIRKEYWTIDP
jgi:hypothetical protein